MANKDTFVLPPGVAVLDLSTGRPRYVVSGENGLSIPCTAEMGAKLKRSGIEPVVKPGRVRTLPSGEKKR